MRNLFPGHFRPSTDSFSRLWKEGIIVPDTNVLLDLYRYPDATSREVLAVFEKVSARLWIPHQVGLEYQWNRDFVIFEQECRYEKTIAALNALLQKLEGEVSDNRHAFIDGESIIATFARARDECVSKIREAEKKQLDLGGDDRITEALGRLFEGRIGPAPSLEKLKKLHDEGDKRFARLQPPGYLDEKKKRKKSEFKSDVHLHNGLEHKRKFGDWIAWSQLLEHVNDKQVKCVILISGETGEDWWQLIGHRRVGPRPELVEEIRGCGADVFFMYDLKRFLEYARTNLAAAVSAESLERVQEVNDARRETDAASDTLIRRGSVDGRRHAVLKWLAARSPHSKVRFFRNRMYLLDASGGGVSCRVVDCVQPQYADTLRQILLEERGNGKIRRIYVCLFSSSDESEKKSEVVLELVRCYSQSDSELHVGFISPQGVFVSVASFTPALGRG